MLVNHYNIFASAAVVLSIDFPSISMVKRLDKSLEMTIMLVVVNKFNGKNNM
jgi:hypothetical protein